MKSTQQISDMNIYLLLPSCSCISPHHLLFGLQNYTSPCTFSIILDSFSCSQEAYPILASVENLFTSPAAWNLFMTPIAKGIKSKLCSSASATGFSTGSSLLLPFWRHQILSDSMAFVGAVPNDWKVFLSFPYGCPTLVFQNQPSYFFNQAFLSIFSEPWRLAQCAYLYLWHVIFSIF